MLVLFFGFLSAFSLPTFVTSISCYHCTSMLKADLDETAKAAMKNLVYTNFNVPPVHELCALPDDIEFRIVEQLTCENDRCIRLQAFENNLHFVMRGCESMLSKTGPLNSSCSPSSPSVCVCDSDLCNSSPNLPNFFTEILFLSIIGAYLVNKL